MFHAWASATVSVSGSLSLPNGFEIGGDAGLSYMSFFDGMIADVRIRPAQIEQSQITAEYNNQTNLAFYAVGTPGDDAPVVTPDPIEPDPPTPGSEWGNPEDDLTLWTIPTAALWTAVR